MHLTRLSRKLIADFCRDSIYHNLLVEFDCEEKCVEDNIKDTATFYQKLDNTQDWLQTFREKNAKFSVKFEKCTPNEGPLISVNNSENQMIHSVTARGVQGLLQTLILGVLSSPVIKHRVFYFSRHGESEFNVLGRIGASSKSLLELYSKCNNMKSLLSGGDSDLSPRGKNYGMSLAKQLGGPGSIPNGPKPRLVS